MIKSYCAYVYGILVWETSKGIQAATRRPPNNKSLTKRITICKTIKAIFIITIKTKTCCKKFTKIGRIQ